MNFSSIKLFFQTLFSYLKKYWYFVVVIATFLIWLFYVKDKNSLYQSLLDTFKLSNERHKQELEELQKIHNEELKKHQEIEKRYNETLKKIEQEHSAALEQLDKNKKQELKKIIAETQDNPNLAAQRISSLFNIPISQ